MSDSARKAYPAVVTQKDIEEGLRQLGLGSGHVVEVHSSLSSFGSVKGGAEAVLAALMSVVGREGALVMSAYPVSLPLPLTEGEKARGIAWKVRKLNPYSEERTGMGAIADAFRLRPDTICGTGLHRVCAWGRDAELFSKGYKPLLEADGWALLIGVEIYRCSSMHQAEARVGIPDEILALVTPPEEIARDYPSDLWAVGYGGTPDLPWKKVFEEADRRGLVKRRRIGNAQCTLFRAEALVSIYEGYLRADPYGLFGVQR